ncbi:MAG: hypothetical protein KJ630_01210 [Proteobacteria bacterium]|nr:hypothetical protein [Pseudomonadota bacterium]
MSDRNTERKAAVLLSLLVAATTTIEAGKMVAFNASGNLVEASDASAVKVIGVADQAVNNSAGADGAKRCQVYTRQLFKLANSGSNAVDVADAGTLVFVEDDQTVADVPGTNGIVAGRCIEVVSDGVWVEIPAMPQIPTQAASTASDAAGAVVDLNALIAKLKAAGLMRNA